MRNIEKIEFEDILANKRSIKINQWGDGDTLFSAQIDSDSSMAHFLVRREHICEPELLFLVETVSAETFMIFSQDDYFYRYSIMHWNVDDLFQYRNLRMSGVPPIDAIEFIRL